MRISPVLDKDAFTQKLEKTDIKVIKESTEIKLKRNPFNIQNSTFMTKTILLEYQHLLGSV